MSDKLENFIKNNREKFDTQNPGNNVWQNIQAGVSQQAAAGSGAASAGAKAGASAAKMATAWKVTAVALLTAVVATTVYFVTRNGDSTTDGKGQETIAAANTNNVGPAAGAQVEHLVGYNPLVKPPIPAADIPYETFTVDAAQGGKYKAVRGTELMVPPGIFVDANGAPIKGEVTLKYREFHDAADIILSGIPMVYDNKGKPENFQTAGMMEIIGQQGDSPVFVAPGKEIEVQMASFTEDDDYGLYILDPEKGWADIGKAKIKKNKAKEEGLRLIAQKPSAPLKRKPNEEFENEVSFEGSYDDFVELKAFKNVRWQAVDPSYYSKFEDKLLGRVWNDIKLEESSDGLVYNIQLKNKHKESLTFKVRPVLDGKDYEKEVAKFKKRMANYEKMLAEKGLEEERIKVQANIYRTFNISGFGIYNCDRFYPSKDLFTCVPSYNFGEGNYVDLKASLVYHITGGNRAVLTIDPNEKLKFFQNDENHLVIIMPGDRIAHFGPAGFKKLENRNALDDPNRKMDINFDILDRKIVSAMDLREVIGI